MNEAVAETTKPKGQPGAASARSPLPPPPPPTPGPHPRGLWVLVFTETWERMSFYGTRPLLMLYMTASVTMGGLGLDVKRAAAIFAGYYLALNVFALSGGQIADRFLGARRTIVLGGIFIAIGQFLLQVPTLEALLVALTCISVGTCLMKPNLSASVGKLYAKEDPRRDAAFTIEYAGINVGSVMAVIICGFMAGDPRFIRLLHAVGLDSPNGWAWAFAMTGFGMMLSLVNFVLRRKLVVDVSLPEGQPEPRPAGVGFVAFQILVALGLGFLVIAADSLAIQLVGGIGGAIFLMFGVQGVINRGWVRTRTAAAQPTATASGVPQPAQEKLSRQDWTRIAVVGMMVAFSLVFWSLFQQAGSSLNLFARDYTRRVFGNPEAEVVALEQARLRAKDIDRAEDRIRGFDKVFAALRPEGPEVVDAFVALKRQRKKVAGAEKLLQDSKDGPERLAKVRGGLDKLRGELPALEQAAQAARQKSPSLASRVDQVVTDLQAAETTRAEIATRDRRLEDQKALLLKDKGGFEIPTVWILTTNPFLVVILGPFFATLWRRRSKKWPSSPVKFALGLLAAGIAFFIIGLAARDAQPAPAEIAQQASLGFLAITYLFATLGELCLSPVGLAYVSRLAPKQLTSQMMGIWFFATGLGSFIAGRVAGLIGTVRLSSLFFVCAIVAVAAALLLWVFVRRLIEKLVGGYS
jgi:amino acid/peptide:H+ symporter